MNYPPIKSRRKNKKAQERFNAECLFSRKDASFMPRALWLLVIGILVNITGTSFLWPLNAIYIHDHLGKSLTVAGIVLTLNSAASVIGNLVGRHPIR